MTYTYFFRTQDLNTNKIYLNTKNILAWEVLSFGLIFLERSVYALYVIYFSLFKIVKSTITKITDVINSYIHKSMHSSSG